MSQSASSAGYSPGCIDTLIGAGMRVVGDISCSGVLRVQGDIEGNIACGGGGDGGLVVDATGSVNGTVTAQHVAVRGRVVGPVRSSRVVEVHSGATVVGDILFAGLSIHPGGVIEGALTPAPGTAAALAPQPTGTPGQATTTPAAFDAAADGPDSRWKLPLMAIVVLAIGVGIWKGRGAITTEPAADPVALRSTAALREERGAPSPSDIATPRAERRDVAESSAPAATPREPVAAAAPANPAPVAAADSDETVEIRGANASRPPGVFLLVTSEATTLYRKKQGDPGEGARIAVGAGERVSVSVGNDELIRVAKGPNAVIFYQGKRVPPEVIGDGVWIHFLPR